MRSIYPVAVVVGGANGIGAALVGRLEKDGYVCEILDPGVRVDGEPPDVKSKVLEEAAGFPVSVLDRVGLSAAFDQICQRYNRLDVVVNAAGIQRPTSLTSGTNSDWKALLDVHLRGYLNVLEVALPILERFGKGVLLGVTSGSGWRDVPAGSYGLAKRGVIAVNQEIEELVPPGVTLAALSPMASTRMVRAALDRRAEEVRRSGQPSSATTGVQIDTLATAVEVADGIAYLLRQQPGSLSGRVIFLNGSEITLIGKPGVIEAKPAGALLSTAEPESDRDYGYLGEAVALQRATGGGPPRLGLGQREAEESAPDAKDCIESSAIMSDDVRVSAVLEGALLDSGEASSGKGLLSPQKVSAEELLEFMSSLDGKVAQPSCGFEIPDLTIVALDFCPAGTTGSGWRHSLALQRGVTDSLYRESAWARLIASAAVRKKQYKRLMFLYNRSSPDGRVRAQALAQLGRSAARETGGLLDVLVATFPGLSGLRADSSASVIRYLGFSRAAGRLCGAEAAVSNGWLGVSSHPTAVSTFNYIEADLPATLPDWW